MARYRRTQPQKLHAAFRISKYTLDRSMANIIAPTSIVSYNIALHWASPPVSLS